MRAQQFIKNISKGGVKSVLFLIGEESQLHKEVVRAVAQYKLGIDNVGEVENIDGNQTSINELVENASSAGLFANERVIIVYNAEELAIPAGSPELKILERFLERQDPGVTVLFSASSANKNRYPFKLVLKYAETIECDRLKGKELSDWMVNHASRNGYVLSSGALELAKEQLGNNLMIVRNALDKVMLYCGERKQIDHRDIASTLGVMREHAIWELTAAIGSRNAEEALSKLAHILDEGKHPLQVTAALQSQFRQLILVKTMLAKKTPANIIAKVAGIRFYIERTIAQAKSFAANELVEAYNVLFNLENRIKSSGPDERFLLEKSIIDVCRSKKTVAT